MKLGPAFLSASAPRRSDGSQRDRSCARSRIRYGTRCVFRREAWIAQSRPRHHDPTGMTLPATFRHATVARIAVAAYGALVPAPALPIDLDSIARASDAVTVESSGPPSLIANGTGTWILYAPALSVDCSPPRGCYARTQRIHYDFSCSPRYAVMTERISMDLNEAIVKHEIRERASRYEPSYDAGAIAVLEKFCPPPTRD